jgi:PAS domain S-box-containing protein
MRREVVQNNTFAKECPICSVKVDFIKSIGGSRFLVFLGTAVTLQVSVIWLEWRHFHKLHQGVFWASHGDQLPLASLVNLAFSLGLVAVVIVLMIRHNRLCSRTESVAQGVAHYARSLIEANLDPWVTISPDGKITDVNEATIQVTGCTREQLVGTEFSNYFTEPDKAREGYRRVLAEGLVRDYSLTIRHASGQLTDVIYNAALYRNECGKVQGVFAAARDMTRRKLVEKEIRQLNQDLKTRVEERTLALTEANERLQMAAEAATIGIWDWDVASNLIRWDSWMFRIYGIPETSNGMLSYAEWCASVHPDDLSLQEASLHQTVEKSGKQQRQFRIIRRSDKAIRVIRASDAAITGPDGKTRRIVGINLDITETVGRVEEIRGLNEQLAKRAAELESSVKELDAFTYSVSHDLRAPLRAIDGFSRLVEEDYASKIDAEGKRMLGVIRSEAKRMGRLIDDLLAFSRLGRQRIEPKVVEMAPLARQVFEELKALEAERTIRLTLHAIPPAFGTEPMIKQVWVNLIANAIKFTGKKIIAEIEIGALEGKEGERIYFIKDNGAGFDMRFADKLFGVFSRLHSAEDFPGTGVGLALVQRIIHRHGGKVWGEGKVDQGATFYFTVPDVKKQAPRVNSLPAQLNPKIIQPTEVYP